MATDAMGAQGGQTMPVILENWNYGYPEPPWNMDQGGYGWPENVQAVQYEMWPSDQGGYGYVPWQQQHGDGSWAVGSDNNGQATGGEMTTGDAGEASAEAADGNAEEGNSRKGRGRGKGGGRNRGGKRGGNDGAFGDNGGKGGRTEFMFYNGAFLGEWLDSLGHNVTVKHGSDRRGPLSAKLKRGDKENVLSLRRVPEFGSWSCGNAILDVWSSGPSCLVWTSPDGRRSVWRKQDGKEAASSPPDLLPWLLHHGQHGSDENSKEDVSAAQVSDDEEKKRLQEDGARISALLDARQVLGSDRQSQELMSAILMDHDLLRREDEDVMVPAADSPLWERLPEGPRRNVLHRLSGFNAATATGCCAELADRDTNMVHIGRHRFSVASTDVQALRRRWTGSSEDVPRRNALMVHVLSLYRTLETPLSADWQRSSFQLGWDPVDRKRAGIDYELFASPFNASVENGRYGSRWPHVETFFGSAGSYPSVIDKFPATASVSVNPPFTDAYLEHVMCNTLERLVDRFKTVHLTVPVREAPWREKLRRLEGATFLRQFWDSTAMMVRPMGHPVMYWTGSKLADP
jgi:hypothetical protein